ncbi:MAG TPA: SufD family Fe-S cluster assembly protein, partial [Thermoanaerobaculia bacterium]|nr:SufD family Fe-S cluster assembly protein [Thermoanaerobaculia bacterium]
MAVLTDIRKSDLAESSFLAGYPDFDRAREGREPGSLGAIRRRAIERFAELGFPTVKQEEWRFTNVAPIARRDFHRVGPGTGSAAREASPEVVRHWLFESAGAHLVFVDGRLAPEHSDLSGLPPGTVLSGLGDALLEHPDVVEAHLARHASFEDHPFVALNTGYLEEGAFLLVPRNAVVEQPIHVLYLSTGETDAHGRPTVAFPRNLVVLDENSQATLVETYAGPEGVEYFNCPVTEIVCGPASVLDHYKMQQESTSAFHMATFQLRQERQSSYAL